MIRHVVIWRVKSEAKSGGKIDGLAPIERTIEAMRSGVAGLQRLELRSNQAGGADAADLLLYAEFDSWQSLHDYEAHPLHMDLRKLMAPLRIERRFLDHEV